MQIVNNGPLPPLLLDWSQPQAVLISSAASQFAKKGLVEELSVQVKTPVGGAQIPVLCSVKKELWAVYLERGAWTKETVEALATWVSILRTFYHHTGVNVQIYAPQPLPEGMFELLGAEPPKALKAEATPGPTEDDEKMRARLNVALEKRHFAEARRLGLTLRKRLVAKGQKDPRSARMLAGVNEVLRGLEDRGYKPPPTSAAVISAWEGTLAFFSTARGRTLLIAGTIGLLIGGLLWWRFVRYDAGYHERAVQCLAALDHIKDSVAHDVKAREYKQQLMELRQASGAFVGDYRDRKDVAASYRAIVAACARYDEAEKWVDQIGRVSSRRVRGEPRAVVEVRRLWEEAPLLVVFAHELLDTGNVVEARRPVYPASPRERLPGGWQNARITVYFDPLDERGERGVILMGARETGIQTALTYRVVSEDDKENSLRLESQDVRESNVVNIKFSHEGVMTLQIGVETASDDLRFIGPVMPR